MKDKHLPLLLTSLEQENKRKETRQEYLLEEIHEYISRIKTFVVTATTPTCNVATIEM